MDLQLTEQQGELLLKLLAREALELRMEKKRDDHVKDLMRSICITTFRTYYGLLHPQSKTK